VRSGLGRQELDRIRNYHGFHVFGAKIKQSHAHDDLTFERRRTLPLGVIVIFGLSTRGEDDVTV
jgi:hypothetical protein